MCFNPNEHFIQLKGKDYLQVAWRLVWFREECPLWSINTELISYDDANGKAVFKAVICDENGTQKSSGYGSESIKDFGDYLEKGETKAVGRALAMLGYGTQFAPELDEGERIVDSPIDRSNKAEPLTYEKALDLVITFGKHNGKPLREIYKIDREYIAYLMKNAEDRIKEAIGMINAEVKKQKENKEQCSTQ